MIVVACVIGGIAAVIARGTRRHLMPAQPTIPFVPGLALGFVVGDGPMVQRSTRSSRAGARRVRECVLGRRRR